MQHLKLLILLMSSSLILYACPAREDETYTIIIKNNTDKAIAWQPRLFNIGEKEEQYNCEYGVGEAINSHSSVNYSKNHGSWDSELGKSRYLQIMVIEKDSAVKYFSSTCDTFRKHVPILHTYRLTLEDLKQRNWIVVYPD